MIILLQVEVVLWQALKPRSKKQRARSIQPKFPEISVQNSMDRFGPTGKVSKKRVHLLRCSTFPGRPVGILLEWIAPNNTLNEQTVLSNMHLFGRACLCVLLPLSTHLNSLSMFDLQFKYFHRTYCIKKNSFLLVTACFAGQVQCWVEMFDFQPWLKPWKP